MSRPHEDEPLPYPRECDATVCMDGPIGARSLKPEDLCALTVEAAAVAKVPLAGTSWIPGVTEGRILAEVERLVERAREEEIAQGAEAVSLRAAGN